MQMVALKSFRGKPGEGKGGGRAVTSGDEIKVGDKARGDYLEKMGLAVPAGSNKAKARAGAPQNKALPGAEANKDDETDGVDGHEDGVAGQDGPLAGGQDGEGEQSSLSGLAQAERVNAPRSGGRGGRRR